MNITALITPRTKRAKAAVIAALLALIAVLLVLVLLPKPAGDHAAPATDTHARPPVLRNPNTPPPGATPLRPIGAHGTSPTGALPGVDVGTTSKGSGGTDGQDDHDPCASVVTSGAHLAVTPDPKRVPSGATASSLTIRNCSTDEVDWTASTVPLVSLGDEAGTIGPSADHELGFEIDESAFDEPTFSFKIKVSEPGHNTYVDVEAFKPGFATPTLPEEEKELGFSSGGPTGCAAQCITKAWLTPNATTPNPALEVTTNTPATIAVRVSTSAPVIDPDGNPFFPGVAPIASSAPGYTQWDTVVGPLKAATDYHIIVTATDADGGVSYRSGTFRTTTSIEHPDQLAASGDAGCSVQCISDGWIMPGGPGEDPTLEVRNHGPARIRALVRDTEFAVDGDGVPQFGGAEPVATSDGPVTTWTVELDGLSLDTTYFIVVEATDDQGRRSFQAGTFVTDDQLQVTVTFHFVRVISDGDSSLGNRGELSFGMGVNDTTVARTPERKIHSNTTVSLDGDDRIEGTSFTTVAGEWLPTAFMDAIEADYSGRFCPAGSGVNIDWGRNTYCNWKWNVASSGLIQTSAIDTLDRCADLGVDGEFAEDACVKMETEPHGEDFPTFFAVVSFRLTES